MLKVRAPVTFNGPLAWEMSENPGREMGTEPTQFLGKAQRISTGLLLVVSAVPGAGGNLPLK